MHFDWSSRCPEVFSTNHRADIRVYCYLPFFVELPHLRHYPPDVYPPVVLKSKNGKKRAKFERELTPQTVTFSNGRSHILKSTMCVTTQITAAKRLGNLEHVCKIAPNIQTVLPKIAIRNPSQSGSVLTILASF